MSPWQPQGLTASLSQETSSRVTIFKQHILRNFSRTDNGQPVFSGGENDIPPPIMSGSRPTRPNPIFTVDFAFRAVPKPVPNPSREASQPRRAGKHQAPNTK